MKKTAVIALGGNALIRDGESGTIDDQERNATATLQNLVHLLNDGYNLVITHGNGPQIGNILMRNDAGEQMYDIPPMPMDICVADSQGGIGYMIERCLRNVLIENGLTHNVLTLMTMVEVNADDEAFRNPTKRIGKMFSTREAQILNQTKGWQFKEDKRVSNHCRRVISSPAPVHIMNREVIEANVQQGTIVIAVGGGGVPVYRDEKNWFRPAEAVIDKDLASALLAVQIHADELYILTDVPFVFANYGEPEQKILEFLNVEDARKFLKNGTFGEGSMAPKIRAAIHFLENGGKVSVITESQKLEDKSFGTKITTEYDPKDNINRQLNI